VSIKPEGSKLCIMNNILYIQDAGPFQPFIRYIYKNNKSELQFLYNPIEFACQRFLQSDEEEEDIEMPDLTHLFQNALNGIAKLMNTYKDNSIIVLCLNYYSNIISNYLGDNFNEDLFKKDATSCYYTDNLLYKLSKRWTNDKLLLVVKFNEYIYNHDTSIDSIKCLETFMQGIDEETTKIVNSTLS
jgi:hypothetical protein